MCTHVFISWIKVCQLLIILMCGENKHKTFGSGVTAVNVYVVIRHNVQ